MLMLCHINTQLSSNRVKGKAYLRMLRCLLSHRVQQNIKCVFVTSTQFLYYWAKGGRVRCHRLLDRSRTVRTTWTTRRQMLLLAFTSYHHQGVFGGSESSVAHWVTFNSVNIYLVINATCTLWNIKIETRSFQWLLSDKQTEKSATVISIKLF